MNNVNEQYKDGDSAPKLSMETLVNSANIAELLPKEYLSSLGARVIDGYAADRNSRKAWEQKSEMAIKLALQVVEIKSFPWTNCSNVKFPLITIAALQFLARVSILTKGPLIVKCTAPGTDPTGEHAARANRVSKHMSYQLIEEDTNWIDDNEKAQFSASIVGCAFKKTYFDPTAGHNLSVHVPAADFVVDYWTKDLEKCNRATHLLRLTANDIKERERMGTFLEMVGDYTGNPAEVTALEAVSNLTQGLSRPADDSFDIFEVLEQHCWLDLDGDDYREPYIVFVRKDTGQVLRVVARYFDQGDVVRQNDLMIRQLRADAREAADMPEQAAKYEERIKELQDSGKNKILRITPMHYFTKIPFIPAQDGGFYDYGLGTMLGPLNESVNSITNQLIDNGTMQNTAGGFLGRGVKIKGGKTSFDPFEWKPVDSTGDDLRKNIVPLPVGQPSAVLFELLGMLISYGERISGATDIMSGVSPGQNTPAETSRNTIEQGMKVFSGIYGRMYRAFRREIRKLQVLNELYLEDQTNFLDLTTGDGAIIAKEDYHRSALSARPGADPSVVSETQRQQKAGLLAERAATQPGYNRYLVEKNLLEAYDIQDIDTLFPDPAGERAVPPPQNPKVELEKAKLQFEQHQFDAEMQLAIAQLQDQMQLTAAKIQKLEAEATRALAEADGVAIDQQIAAINAQTGAARAHQDGLVKSIQAIQKIMDSRSSNSKTLTTKPKTGEVDGTADRAGTA